MRASFDVPLILFFQKRCFWFDDGLLGRLRSSSALEGDPSYGWIGIRQVMKPLVVPSKNNSFNHFIYSEKNRNKIAIELTSSF
jgi:hypothetical protein